MHPLKDKVSRKHSNPFVDPLTQSASPCYSLAILQRPGKIQVLGKRFLRISHLVLVILEMRMRRSLMEMGKKQVATMISNGQDKDSELCVSAKVESGYNEGMRQIEELTESSAFISANLFEFLYACLPNLVRGCKWILLYRVVVR